MSRGKGAEIIKSNPYIDEYISSRESPFELIKKLKNRSIDFAIATNPSTSGLGVLYLSGIPRISSFTVSGPQKIYSRMYNILKKLVVQIPLKTGVFIPAQYLNLLEPLGIHTDDMRFELFSSQEADKEVQDFLSKNNVKPGTDFIVALAPGGSTDIRWWAAEKYAALADHLFKKYQAKIFLIGAGSDRKPIEDMISFMDKQTKYLNLLNQPIEEFKAFMSRVNLVIGNDSGPMTIAKAFNAAQMVFIGPTDEREYQLPNGPLNRIVKSKTRGEPITNSLNWISYDEKEARRQMTEITLEDAIKELDILMKNLGR
jgi:ADP-heptose:LPS heptosyltransferase